MWEREERKDMVIKKAKQELLERTAIGNVRVLLEELFKTCSSKDAESLNH